MKEFLLGSYRFRVIKVSKKRDRPPTVKKPRQIFLTEDEYIAVKKYIDNYA